MAEIRIVLADDHAILRDGLRSLIDRQRDMTVVGEAADTASAVVRCAEMAPDVAVLDLAMPGGGGLDALRRLRQECPRTRVLVLTMHDDASHLRAVLDAGAAGYLVKRSAATDLLDAIREVHAGRAYVRGTLSARPARPAAGLPGAGTSALSQREREVLVLLARGHSNREVAERLGVAKKSVDTYRLRLQEKLGLKGRAALVRYALAAGLIGRASEPAPAGDTEPEPDA